MVVVADCVVAGEGGSVVVEGVLRREEAGEESNPLLRRPDGGVTPTPMPAMDPCRGGSSPGNGAVLADGAEGPLGSPRLLRAGGAVLVVVRVAGELRRAEDLRWSCTSCNSSRRSCSRAVDSEGIRV